MIPPTRYKLLLRLLAKTVKKGVFPCLWRILYATRCERDLPIVRQRDAHI
nr:MAG TPA: hypothetical protein [Caudoviricetes sp.]